jgi:hypothetical protein
MSISLKVEYIQREKKRTKNENKILVGFSTRELGTKKRRTISFVKGK